MTLLILKALLALLVFQALMKFAVFFFVKYETRRKMLDSQYGEKTSATTKSDILLLGQDLRSVGLTSHDPRITQLGPQVGAEQTLPHVIQILAEFLSPHF